MRALTFTALAAGLFLMATAGLPAMAQVSEPAYCTIGGRDTDGQCNFYTLEQCRTFVQGVGGSCVPNPRAMRLPQDGRGIVRPQR